MEMKGAIFDMDGLLFDTENIYQETWNELAAENGVTLGIDFVGDICGTSGAHMCRVLEKHYGVADGSVIMEECMKRVRQKLKVHVPKKSGAERIVKTFCDKGIRLAVASSSYPEQIASNLKLAGMREYFDAVVSGKEVKHGKPAPDIFLLAAERIHCTPETCYVFEDSENGIRAGKAAGCTAIMIPDVLAPSEEIKKFVDGIYESLDEFTEEVLEKIPNVWIANYNCPGQIVITGLTNEVQQASLALKEAGAKRVVELKVSGPFHSLLLKPAGEALLKEMESMSFSTLQVPYVANATAEIVTDSKKISTFFAKGIYSSVRWQQSIETMLENGVDTFVEIGPGKTLAGFMRKIAPKATVYNVSSFEDAIALEKCLSKA